MAESSLNPRFQVRESEEELKKLDEAIKKLGYVNSKGEPDRAQWFKDMKRKTLAEAKDL